jgi:CMP/dCMP kinase
VLIAIDGPSGAGKGTVARAVAEALTCRHVDTGAMYRAVAWLALHDDVSLDDEPRVAELARRAVFDLGGGRIAVDGHDVTAAIRTPDIDQAATRVARLPAVRRMLVERQRDYAAGGAVVMEGRDIGTVVLPGAAVKVYLDADPVERARRRAADAAHASHGSDVHAVATALDARDRSDRTRATAPLTLAPDALYIDTTHLGIADVVARVLTLVRERGGRV